MRIAARLVLLALTGVGVLLLFVFPLRTLLDQQHQISATRGQIASLNRENSQLAAQLGNDSSRTAVERAAHAEFGLVMPGQKSYAVVPPTTGPTTVASGSSRSSKASSPSGYSGPDKRTSSTRPPGEP